MPKSKEKKFMTAIIHDGFREVEVLRENKRTIFVKDKLGDMFFIDIAQKFLFTEQDDYLLLTH
jgi:hypothetical protein